MLLSSPCCVFCIGQVPAAWRAELDSDALRARARAFKDEAGEEPKHSYPGGWTGKAWRTDFTDATSPRASREHGPVALWRVGAVESFRETFEYCPFFEGAGLERWRVGRGQDFGWMFYGCESLRPRLGGWRLPSAITMDEMLAWTGGWGPAIGDWLEGHPNPEAVDVQWMLKNNQGALPPAVRGSKSRKERREALPGWGRYWSRCKISWNITGW